MGVNYLAIIVSAIVGYAIGMIWYSPLLFGNIWMNLQGFSKKDISKAKKKGMGKVILLGFITTLIMTLVLNYLIGLFGYAAAADGALLGFWIWLGFLATTMLGSVLWENKPVPLYLINTAHYLVVLVVIGAILGAWT